MHLKLQFMSIEAKEKAGEPICVSLSYFAGPVPVPLRGTKEDQGPEHLGVDGLCKVSTISDI